MSLINEAELREIIRDDRSVQLPRHDTDGSVARIDAEPSSKTIRRPLRVEGTKRKGRTRTRPFASIYAQPGSQQMAAIP